MKKFRQFIRLITIALCLISLCSMSVYADTVSELEQKKSEAEKEASALESEESQLSADAKAARQKYDSLMANIKKTSDEISSNSAQIEELSKELAQANMEENRIVESLKVRIRYMYQNGNRSMVDAILSSTSFSELINNVRYTNAVLSYDDQQLKELAKLKEEIETKSEELKSKQLTLEVKQNQLDSQKTEVSNLVATTGAALADKSAEVDAANATVSAYEQQIERMKAQEAALAAKNADAQIAKSNQVNKNEDTSGAVDASASDVTLLAALIQAEAGGEVYDGKLAVGSVVMNRVKSSSFPNTISGVIYQSGQFSPAASGRLQLIINAGPSSDCIAAANAVISGSRNVDKLFFMPVSIANSKGLSGGLVIGNHYFY